MASSVQPASTVRPATAARLQSERSRQVRGLLLLALAVIVFSVVRFGADRIFTTGWWRLW